MTYTNGASPQRVAILIENQFEDSEFKIPYTALQKAGAAVTVLGSRMNDEYRGKRGNVSIRPDATATEMRAEDFDAILIPGGAAPDQIRMNPNAVKLVTEAIAQDKLIAAVCHGPQVLIEADQLRDKRATGFRAIRKDMENAGAEYINEPVVEDGNLITARQPSDLPMFTTALLQRLGLTIQGVTLPDVQDQSFAWWQLGEAWGGSSRTDILNALNMAIVGERYTMTEFREYGDRVTDPELSLILQEICNTKQQHLDRLEARLRSFDEQVTWQAFGGETLAKLQSWLQSKDDIAILRRALGDMQTGVVDAYHLYIQITDPATAHLLAQIETNLAQYEQLLADLYRVRAGREVQPPTPTTVAVA